MGNPSAMLREKWANGSEVGGAGGCCPTPECCAMRAERLGAALGVPWTESLSELEVELLPLSLSSPPSLPPKGRHFNKQASPILPTKLSSTHLLSLS